MKIQHDKREMPFLQRTPVSHVDNMFSLGLRPFFLQKKGLKGYVYTLEVMLAVSLIFVTLILVFSSSPEEAETSLGIMKQNGYDALFYLDMTGDLRNAVSRGAVSEIDANLTDILPKNLKFDTNICTTSCNSTELPANSTIVTVDYYISGYRGEYIGKRVRMWMWRKF